MAMVAEESIALRSSVPFTCLCLCLCRGERERERVYGPNRDVRSEWRKRGEKSRAFKRKRRKKLRRRPKRRAGLRRKLRAKKRDVLKMKRNGFRAKGDVDCIHGHWSNVAFPFKSTTRHLFFYFFFFFFCLFSAKAYWPCTFYFSHGN